VELLMAVGLGDSSASKQEGAEGEGCGLHDDRVCVSDRGLSRVAGFEALI
jgi:hypothetical protein